MPFIPTLTHPCPCKRNKQKGETVQVPLSVCARQQSWPAHLQMYMGTLHFSKAQFFQKFLRVWLLCSTISFTQLHLLSCYQTFTIHCLCSLLTACISPTWQNKSASSFSLVSPSVPLPQCQIAQVANTDGECFITNRKGVNYSLDVSLEDDSEH